MSSKFTELMAQARSRQEADPAEELPQEAAVPPGPEPQAAAEPQAEAEGAHKPEEVAAKAISAPPIAAEAHPPSTTDLAALEHALLAPIEGEANGGEAKRRGRPRGKRSHPDFEQVSAYISKRTHLSVKIALLQEGEGREFSELVEELLDGWLKR